MRLCKHVHCCPSGKEDGGESEKGEEEKDRPRFIKVESQDSPGGVEGATDSPIGLAVGTQIETELDRVDLDQIEIETKDGCD